MIDAQLQRRSIERAREEQAKRGELGLRSFIEIAWHIVEPVDPFVGGWHIDAMCAHLEAVTRGDITRLLINVPPGAMKSLLVNVFWPAWEWGPKNLPHLRYNAFSYDSALSIRDAVKMRRLIQSEWYVTLWGTRFKLTSDQNVKSRFENDKTGYRLADSVGRGTGERAHRNQIDDPHNIKDGESEVQRKGVITWFNETLTTRVVSPEHSAIIVIMQRVHEQDVSGEIIARHPGYVHLKLPMEFDPDRRCVTTVKGVPFFRDPRTVRDELIFPARFPRSTVDRDKAIMGVYAVAGQFQQEPTARQGATFERGKVSIIPAAPAGMSLVRRWDLAASKKTTTADPARTCGVLMGKTDKGRIIIVDCVAEQLEGHNMRLLIANTAAQDKLRYGDACEISLPQDPGGAGKIVSADLIAMLAGYRVTAEPETGDKETRAEPFSAQWNGGNVDLVEGPWVVPFLDEVCMFPNSKFKDRVDACSGAFGKLVMGSAGMGIFEYYRREREKSLAAEKKIGDGKKIGNGFGLRLLRPNGSQISTAFGMSGRSYNIDAEGAIIVAADDFAAFKTQGWTVPADADTAGAAA